MDSFFYLIIVAGALAGASTGLLGVYIVGMRMPFIGTCISHAAMAGTIFALLAGFNPMCGAIIASVITSTSLAAIRPDKLKLDTNVTLAILFSLMLGLTFLGIGLVQGSRTEALSLLWGSLLFVRFETTVLIGIMGLVLVLFVAVFNKELKVILFSRSIAAATGIHEAFVYGLYLALCGVILSVNLKTIGGLLIFSLITNPAAAAYQICRGYRSVVIVSSLLGMLSAIFGFLASFYFDLPTGACIAIATTLIFVLAVIYRRVIGMRD